MKLISMHADNFGVLHNYTYNFDDGLNVVLHDNGWGKTTMAAFLKAMLYGYDSKRSKDITENERRRYLPWQGGKYGGYLDFEAEGVNYRVYRSFGETPRFDTVKIVNLDTNSTARIDPDKLGETLFHLDASAFQRSVFINQNGLEIEGAASSIHSRLNKLVSQANDVAAFDDAIKKLTESIKVYEKTGARGRLGDIARQIDEKERVRDRFERSIAEQDSARERICQIVLLLQSINKELDEKSKKLDEVFGESKKREEAAKILEDISKRTGELTERAEAIRSELGGSVPMLSEIDQVKRQMQSVSEFKTQIDRLERESAKLKERYGSLVGRYGGVLPSSKQLDGIQSIYGELQGAISSSREEASNQDISEEYELIRAAVDEDPVFADRLGSAIDSQTEFQELIGKLKTDEQRIKDDSFAWSEKKKKYAALLADVDRRRNELCSRESYDPETVEPVISKLEELQKKQQAVDLRRETMASDLLTPEQEEILSNSPSAAPDANEGNTVLAKFRNAEKHRAQIQGLSARLEGERSRISSLKASIDQLDAVSSIDDTAPDEKASPAGKIMIALGAFLSIISIILGIVVNPALFAATVIGVILAVIGIVSNSSGKKKLDESRRQAADKIMGAAQKKKEIAAQLTNAQESVDSLEKQMSELATVADEEENAVTAWLSKWGSPGSIPSESAISSIIENAERVKKYREIQARTASSRGFIRVHEEQIAFDRGQIDKAFPECVGKTIADAIKLLRRKVAEYRFSFDRLQEATRNMERFLEETGISPDAIDLDKSPMAPQLKAERDKTVSELNAMLAEANNVLSKLELDTDIDHIIQALREAGEMMNEFIKYEEKLKEQETRAERKEQRIIEIKERLNDSLIPFSGLYPDLDIPERLSAIREDVLKAGQLNAQMESISADIEGLRARLKTAEAAVSGFAVKYKQSSSDPEGAITAIIDKADKYRELTAAKLQVQREMEKIERDRVSPAVVSAESEEAALRADVDRLKTRQRELTIEYTQKSDFIRQTDAALEQYPDTVQEIHELYEEKQKAQSRLAVLKRTIQLITTAKENLANRYLSRVEDLFNSYMRIWLNNDRIRGILDIDFNVSIAENNGEHVAEGYSTGYCDMIDFCMRLALVDTLFENEQPFLIMDDPFVNLDEDRLEKAMELLKVMAANKQIVYFVCHPIRAVEAEGNSVSRDEFKRLAETAKKAIGKRAAGASSSKINVRRSPKEMYKLVGLPDTVPFKPADPDYIITNNIFSLSFVPTDSIASKDGSFELFFIDAVGHVLNDRKLLEFKNHKLSEDRVQFSLNTRDDSGSVFELMIRETGKDDYEVAARIPFRAKIAFAGTFNFDL